MQRARTFAPRSQGFTLVEVAISMLVIAFGLLGLFAMQAKAERAEVESYGRVQALVLIQDMIDRMNANRHDAFALAYVTASPVGGSGALADCTAKTGATLDLCEWGNLLTGASETVGGQCGTTSGTGCVGAMVNASGCITYDATTELPDASGAVQAGTGTYKIGVVWQGLTDTVIPAANLDCVSTLAGARMVTATLRVGALGAQ